MKPFSDRQEKTEFSIQDGLEVQAKQLADWKRILNDKFYNLLLAECLRKNALSTITSGYDIFRGTEMDNFIHNSNR